MSQEITAKLKKRHSQKFKLARRRLWWYSNRNDTCHTSFSSSVRETKMKILYNHRLLHKRHLDSSMVTSTTTKLNRTTLSRNFTVPKRSLAFHNSSKSFLQDLSFNQEKASMKEYQLLAYTPSSFLLAERISITFLNYDLKPMTRKSTFILFSHRCLLFLK